MKVHLIGDKMSDNHNNISNLIKELVSYGIKSGLIPEDDRIYCINRLLELFGENEYSPSDDVKSGRDLHLILEDMTEYAIDNNILESDTITSKDLFDTKIMGLITPPPSVVRDEFSKRYKKSPKEATDW